jgi:hypothetical protein
MDARETPAALIRRIYAGVRGAGPAGRPPPGGRLGPLRARTYGELTAVGIRQLARATGLGPGDRFVDLGSGLGKVVLHLAMAVPGIEARGIEIYGARHAAAEAALTRVQALGRLAPGSQCRFEHADLRHAGLEGASVLFANSTCFPAPLLHLLARRIAALAPPVTFATLQKLAGRAAAPFEALGEHPCACSWHRANTVFVYRLPG